MKPATKKALKKEAAAKKTARKVVPMDPKQAVRNAERAWSLAIKTGCAPSPHDLARDKMKAFLEKTLAVDYTNIDHVATVRPKKEDIANCVEGRYVVNSLTPAAMQCRRYGDRCVVVVGRDVVEATFNGNDVSGNFIWTDTWVKFGTEWKCVASHGSKLPVAG